MPLQGTHFIGGHILEEEKRLTLAIESSCDETAVALVRPSRSLYDLEVSSVRKKWKDKAFAAGANREVIAQGAAEFGVDLWEHTANVITAMRAIAPTLGMAGNPPQD